jgi:chlorite dismutase
MLQLQHILQSTKTDIERFETMAATVARSHTVSSILGAMADIFVGIAKSLTQIGEANAKVRRIQDLSCLSDPELEARGVKRENIIRHVMADVL